MKLNFNIFFMLTVSFLLVFSCNLEQASPDENVENNMAPLSVSRAGDCGIDCEPILNECYSRCIEAAHGNPGQYPMIFNQCMNGCIDNEYVPCLQVQAQQPPIPAQYVLKEYGKTICSLDVDRHLFNIDIELYTADRYVDLSCKKYMDKWKLRRIGKVSASYWTLITDKNAPATKVQRKIEELMSQGYMPAPEFFEALSSDPECDVCQKPRL